MNQDYIATQDYFQFQNDWDWSSFFPPHNACGLNHPACRRCEMKWCAKHGQARRIDIKNEKLTDIDPSLQYKFLTLKFGHFCHSERIVKARNHFSNFLKNHKVRVVDWTLHFVEYVPHLNFITYVTGITGYSTLTEGWKDALNLVHINPPTIPISRYEPIRSLPAWLNYIYQCNRVLQKGECPPAHKNYEWRYCKKRKRQPKNK